MKNFENSQSADVIRAFEAPSDGSFKIENWDTHWEGPDALKNLSDKELKKRAKKFLKSNLEHLKSAQELL